MANSFDEFMKNMKYSTDIDAVEFADLHVEGLLDEQYIAQTATKYDYIIQRLPLTKAQKKEYNHKWYEENKNKNNP